MRAIFIIGISLLCIINAQGQEWIGAAVGTDSVKYYIRSEYVSKDDLPSYPDTTIKVWVRAVYPKFTYNRTVYKNAEMKFLWEVVCNKKQFKIVSMLAYSSTGKLINQDNSGKFGPPIDAVPGTISEIILTKICELFSYKGE